MATTSEDVWRLLAELTAAQKETDLLLKEVSQQQKENAQQLKETDLLLKEVSQQQKENAQQQKKTDKQLKELGQQIGGLGAKFGSFTEGLALPSMEKILRQRFGMEVVSPSVRVSKDGKHLEIDVLAYTNGELNTAYIVEVKSHAREESITQLKSILQRFRSFFPEHKDKKLYGILASVDLSNELREKILQEGFYVARIHDQVFELDIPDNFQPRPY
ncbi:DUF3782 domain-containing protein [Microcystis sp. LEGE 00066]|uniref:DUF3782 domain-containing protein n=3 Tax=Microcystis aeruginosa TaxID=1126 RepID=A0AB33C3G7_MICA7|nr:MULTISPECIES: DUF3782 domain-containing protein [Microcystis]ARI82486.1 hypothetical protein BH695_3207 [Microcystis aeruginosa PCC 7806SL]ELS45454.1 hypothetical protein C789_4773 [Microcystis aeruginosa FACHB-905 = DIANCHI905]MBE9260710.1 DUF3782 domain-containing protein [Microcystis sp. LEGE 00066]UGS10636.1 DUF3782 domain-containing protein [Microcystis aeruginosa FACHB-905 = DIANCHI905]WKX61752.1 DUF3782 domain-containing protein [Microcystis aeruginosa PCC 7806]